MTTKILSNVIDPEVLWKIKKTLSPCINSFSNYFLNSEDMSVLKYKFINLCKNSDLENEQIRPMAWKIFLKVLPCEDNSNLKTWIIQTCSDRQNFENIKKRDKIDNINNINNRNPNINNNKNDLRKLIQQDINRTFQNIKLFKDSCVKEVLVDILFYWSIQSENKNMSYRQGMNDLLSILFFSFFPFYFSEKRKSIKNNDIQNVNDNNQLNNNDLYSKEEKLFLLSLCKEPTKNAKTLYLFFHDEKYICHDLFTIFSSMMSSGIRKLYETPYDYKINTNSSQEDFFSLKEKKLDVVYKRALNIYHNMLRNYDENLFTRLIKKRIDPTTYMVRWLRCLFCREFSYVVSIQMWDIIFIEEFFQSDNLFQFIDYICVAMYENIREEIMAGDEEKILKLLFRYPQIDSPKNLIKNAYKIRSFFEFSQYQNNGNNNNKEVKINLNKANENHFNSNNLNKKNEIQMTKKEKEIYDFNKKDIGHKDLNFNANKSKTNSNTTDFKLNYMQIPRNDEGFILQNMAIVSKLKNLEKKYGSKIQKEDDEDLKFIIGQLYHKFNLK